MTYLNIDYVNYRNYLASYINNNNMYVIHFWRPVHYLQITKSLLTGLILLEAWVRQDQWELSLLVHWYCFPSANKPCSIKKGALWDPLLERTMVTSIVLRNLTKIDLGWDWIDYTCHCDNTSHAYGNYRIKLKLSLPALSIQYCEW